MRFIRYRYLSFFLWILFGKVSAQTRVEFDYRNLSFAPSGWSYTLNPDSVKGIGFHVFRKYSDNTLDSDYSIIHLFRGELDFDRIVDRSRQIAGAREMTGRVPLDTISIRMRMTDLKSRDLMHKYIVVQNGRIRDSGLIKNCSTDPSLPYPIHLWTSSSLGQTIRIILYNKKGKYTGAFEYSDLPRPFLITPLFAAQEPAFLDVLEKVRNRDTSLVLPEIDWKRYGLLGPTESIYVGNRLLQRPIVLDIPQPHQPLKLLMKPLPDTVAYEYCAMPEEAFADSLPWVSNPAGNPIITLPEMQPGTYIVRVRYNRFNSESLTYYVAIRPSNRHLILWAVLVGIALLAGAGILILRQKLRFRKRERRLKTERQLADLQNQVYRSQLNPHFIFNALSSIQSLMNKGEIPKANDYLSDFAGLLRHTLDAQKSEFWSLDDELNLLKNYVRLEQLRFSFRFELALQDGIVPVNHAFPAMLLQPVVENAIRHGFRHDAASLLTVHIRRTGTDLVIVIVDNGRGFDTLHVQQGDGLRLTHERITFLNRQGERWRFILQSGAGGTAATFTGKDYFQDDETRA